MDKEIEKLQEKILRETSVSETSFNRQEASGTSAVAKMYRFRYRKTPEPQSPATGYSSERWWIWICVGMFIVISIINIWFGMMVSDNQFGKTRLIPYDTIFTLMYILFECFGILFISVISDLRTLYQLKKKKNCITNKTE